MPLERPRHDPARPSRAGRTAAGRAGPPLVLEDAEARAGRFARCRSRRPGRPEVRPEAVARPAGARVAADVPPLRYLAGLDAERPRLHIRTMALDGHEPPGASATTRRPPDAVGGPARGRPPASGVRPGHEPAHRPGARAIVIDLGGTRPRPALLGGSRAGRGRCGSPADRRGPRRAPVLASCLGRRGSGARRDVGRRRTPVVSSPAVDQLALDAVAAARGGAELVVLVRPRVLVRAAAGPVRPRCRRHARRADRGRPRGRTASPPTRATSSTCTRWRWSSPSARPSSTRGSRSSGGRARRRRGPRSDARGRRRQPPLGLGGGPAQDAGPDGDRCGRLVHRRLADRRRGAGRVVVARCFPAAVGSPPDVLQGLAEGSSSVRWPARHRAGLRRAASRLPDPASPASAPMARTTSSRRPRWVVRRWRGRASGGRPRAARRRAGTLPRGARPSSASDRSVPRESSPSVARRRRSRSTRSRSAGSIVRRFVASAMSVGALSARGASGADHRDPARRWRREHRGGRRGPGVVRPGDRAGGDGTPGSSRWPRGASA